MYNEKSHSTRIGQPQNLLYSDYSHSQNARFEFLYIEYHTIISQFDIKKEFISLFG